MTARPMTAADYASLGIEAPPEFCTLGVGCEMYGICYARAQGRPDMCGQVDTSPVRCEECGDETGECHCAEEA